MPVDEMGESGSRVIAAVDLGSNSFHMIVGELRHGQLTIIDRLRETVRLSEGLRTNGDLVEPARSRALDCLSRFGERIHDMQAESVRAAGTSSLRRARDSKNFLEDAENALGHPIEVISGIEEARLIYSGVSNSTPPTDGFRLVLDIGGGSTELILGHGTNPKSLESLHMGCVVMTEKHFADGRISREAFQSARMEARLKLRPVKAYFRDATDIEAIGTSGTIRATEAVAQQLGICDTQELTPAIVEQLIEKVLEFETTSDISLPGLSDRRAQVWPGGLAILAELLSVLRVDKLAVSDGALREGLLYDYLGRLQHEDARERSVAALELRYHVDQMQAQRVEATAQLLLQQCADAWGLQSALVSSMLSWASRLHEIGLDIAHSSFEEHGAYIVGNADLPGFPRNEQSILAFMILNQRGQLDQDIDKRLQSKWRRSGLRLTILLRLAVLLNRSRSSQELPGIKFEVDSNELRLRFAGTWLEQNPLSVADLAHEQKRLSDADIELKFD